MIGFIYKKCFAVLGKKPIRLWGLSLLAMLLCELAAIFGVLPIISVPVVLTISAGMALVFLDGYREKEVDATQIFKGFKDFARVAGGMAWMMLWVFLWALIPVVGIVFAVIKVYSYRFTPYILMTEPDISATDALKESMKRTKGLRGKMFLADFFVMLAVWGGMLLLGLLATARYVGAVFGVLYVVFSLLVIAFAPLLLGLLSAAFYEERNNMPQPVAYYGVPQAHCGNCGAAIGSGSMFCAACGAPAPPPVQQQPYPGAPYPTYQPYSGTAPQAPPVYQAPPAPQPPADNGSGETV